MAQVFQLDQNNVLIQLLNCADCTYRGWIFLIVRLECSYARQSVEPNFDPPSGERSYDPENLTQIKFERKMQCPSSLSESC